MARLLGLMILGALCAVALWTATRPGVPATGPVTRADSQGETPAGREQLPVPSAQPDARHLVATSPQPAFRSLPASPPVRVTAPSLSGAGEVFGRVANGEGQPVPGALVRYGGLATGLSATSDEEGRYRLADVPTGDCGLVASAASHIQHQRYPVWVEERGPTGPVDFVLRKLESISGRVVDQTGKPVPGARVECCTVPGHDVRRARADDAGRFELTVASGVEVVLAACEADAGPMAWVGSSMAFAGPRARAGDRDVVVELLLTEPHVQPVEVALRVHDAETGRPVSRVRINVGRWRPADPGPPSVDQAGIHVAHGIPAVEWITITADGYQGRSVAVPVPDADGEPVPVPLTRGATISGRVLLDGRPLEGAAVGVVGRSPEHPQRAPSGAGGGISDQHGRFTVVSRAVRDAELVVRGPRGSGPTKVGARVPLGHVQGFEPRDVGDVECVRDGRIAGTVRVPEGVSPRKLRLRLLPEDAVDGEGRAAGGAMTDADGDFEIVSVPPGRYRLLQDGRRGAVPPTAGLPVEVRSGETTEVIIDTLTDGEVPMTMTFTVDGAPAEAGSLAMFLETGDGATARRWQRLGPTGQGGRAGGTVPPRRTIRPGIRLRSGIFHAFTGEEVASLPGRTLERSIAFETARLRCTVPGEIAIPTGGSFRVRVLTPDARGEQPTVTVLLADGRPRGVAALFATLAGQTLELRGFAPGATRVEVALFEDLRPGSEGEPLHVVRGPVTFVRGRTAELAPR